MSKNMAQEHLKTRFEDLLAQNIMLKKENKSYDKVEAKYSVYEKQV